MKLKYEFETTELGDEIIAVPVGDHARDFGGVLNLNVSAAAILKRLREDTTVEQIVASLMEEFEGSKETLTAFVENYVEKLRGEGLLCE